jgi:hypothetical protein
MHDSIVEFIKNAGLVTIITFLIVIICVLMGPGLFLLARTTVAVRWLLLVGIVPVLSGILALYLKFKYAGVVMMGMPTEHTIAASKREGVIDVIAGSTAGAAILLLAIIRRRTIKNSNG